MDRARRVRRVARRLRHRPWSAGPGPARRPPRPGGRRGVAAVHARDQRGPDRRRVGIRRVRRDRQSGRDPVDLAGLEVVYATSSGSTVTRKATWAASDAPRAGAAGAARECRGPFAPWRRCHVHGRVRGDRRGDRAAASSAGRRSTPSAGAMRRTRFVEGTAATARADRLEPRAAAGWRGRQRVRHERQRALARAGVPSPQGYGAAGARPAAPVRRPRRPGPDADPTHTDADARRPRHRSRRRRPPRLPRDRRVLGRWPTRPRPRSKATLTTSLGALEAGRSAFVQDGSGGLGLYLDARVASPLPRTVVRVIGALGTRFGQRVLRIDEAAIAAGPCPRCPTPARSTPARPARNTKVLVWP